GDMAAIGRRHEQAQATGRSFGRVGIAPLRQAAAAEALARHPVGEDEPDIADPTLGAGRRIERYRPTEGRAEDEASGREDRRRLELAVARPAATPLVLAGVVGPGPLQVTDVVPRELAD